MVTSPTEASQVVALLNSELGQRVVAARLYHIVIYIWAIRVDLVGIESRLSEKIHLLQQFLSEIFVLKHFNCSNNFVLLEM